MARFGIYKWEFWGYSGSDSSLGLLHVNIYFWIELNWRKQRNMFGARIKIIWEEQLVDPLADYTTSVIALKSSEMNKWNVILRHKGITTSLLLMQQVTGVIFCWYKFLWILKLQFGAQTQHTSKVVSKILQASKQSKETKKNTRKSNRVDLKQNISVGKQIDYFTSIFLQWHLTVCVYLHSSKILAKNCDFFFISFINIKSKMGSFREKGRERVKTKKSEKQKKEWLISCRKVISKQSKIARKNLGTKTR